MMSKFILSVFLFFSTLNVFSQSYYDSTGTEITFVEDNDEDGVLNAYDLDDDNDGIYDVEEACDGDFSFSSSDSILYDATTQGESFVFTSISGLSESYYNSLLFSVTTCVTCSAPNVKVYLQDSDANQVGYSVVTNDLTTDGATTTYEIFFENDTVTELDLIIEDNSSLDAGYTYTVSDVSLQQYCDTDGDGVPNFRDTNSDNDACTDANEAYDSRHADYSTDEDVEVDDQGLVTTASYSPTATENVILAADVNVDERPVDAQIIAGQHAIFTSFATVAFAEGYTEGEIEYGEYTGSGITYQWFISSDGGLTQTALTDDDVYRGTNSPVLSITNASTELSGNLYRVVIRHADVVCWPQGGNSGGDPWVELYVVEVDSVTNEAAVEGDTILNTVTLTGASTDAPLDILFSYAGITATEEDDFSSTFVFSDGVTYNSATGLISVPVGVSEFTVATVTVDDLISEDNETFELYFDEFTSSNIIVDNDSTPSVLIEDVEVVEGEDAIIYFSLSNISGSDTTIDFVTNIDSASADDFTSVTSSVTIPAGELSSSITIETIDDSLIEDSEVFTLEGTIQTTNTRTTSLISTITIVDNEELIVPSISMSDIEITEGESATLVVELSSASGTDISMSLITFSDTADEIDYNPISELVTIPAGDTTYEYVIETIDDDLIEEIESFEVTGVILSANTENTSFSNTISIIDNDSEEDVTPTVSVNNVGVLEGESATATISLSSSNSTDTSFFVSTISDSATTADYEQYNEFLTIPAGETSLTVTIATTDDDEEEGVETFSLSVFVLSANTVNDNVNGTITISDNDSPSLSITGTEVTEGETLAMSLVLSEASSFDTQITLTSTDGTAEGSIDYTSISETIIISAGDTSYDFELVTTEDSELEVDETLTISAVVSSSNTLNTYASNTVSIIDDEDLPSVTVDNVTIEEGNTGEITISLSEANASDTEISVSVTNNTTSDDDYSISETTVTIPTGDTSVTLSIEAIDDLDLEGDEDFTLSLSVTSSNTSNSELTSTVTIDDNDDIPTVLISDVEVTEGESVTVTVELSMVDDINDTVIDLSTLDGTATSGVDYTSYTDQLTILAGETSGTITLSTIDDLVYEGSEDFSLYAEITSGNTSNTEVTATVTVLENETAPEFSIADLSINEGVTDTVVITLSGESSTDISIDVLTSDNTAVADEDYLSISSAVTVTILAGSTTGSFDVTSYTDDNIENTEEFYIDASLSSGTTLNSSVQSLVYITDINGAASCGVVGSDTTDTDGDGLTDCEEVNGLGYDDPSTVGVAIEVTSTDDPCDVLPSETGAEPVTLNAIWSTADCDGDGVTNGDEYLDGTDYFDECSFIFISITTTVSSTADCDGDGVSNSDEASDSTDSQDDCDFVSTSITLSISSEADCDGDGVLNSNEISDDTDPFDDCSFLTSSISETITANVDCDGDAVSNAVEYSDGTDPFDECDFESESVDLVNFSIERTTNCIESSNPLKVYNTINPNGDNLNDFLVIEGVEETSYNHIEIFNRWGTKVFETEDYQEEANRFYGISDGDLTISDSEYLPAGTYYYILKYTLDGVEYDQIGYLYIN